MQKCLGIYIESNIIKYAKVSKDRSDIKIESFGIRFFEDAGKEIEKIVEETFSFNTPISINLANEKYLYFDVFALLNKKDIKKTVETEFESFCDEKQYNVNAFETRYALTKNINDSEKIRAVNVYANKIDLTRQTEIVSGYKVETIIPTSIAIGSLANLNKRENQLIVNMEEKTTITTVIDQQIYNIETLDCGSREVLDNINKAENSYAKAYDICKNTTIYTAEVEETEQPYLLYIVPTIYKVAQRLQEIIADGGIKYQTIYITGTLASVNNVDLYFQEFLPNIEVKILKPKFIEGSNAKINLKEYIEVNTAIALAMCGLGEGIKDFNFKKESTKEKLANMFKIETKSTKSKQNKAAIRESFRGELVTSEIWSIRESAALLLFIIIFYIFSGILKTSMFEKESEIDKTIATQNAQITAMNSNQSSLNTKKQKYEELIRDLEEIDRKTNDIAASRNLIPNLLSQIMFVIPDKVQLTSLTNTAEKKITIQAQSSDYEQLGYFIATIKTKNILRNVVSSSGTKSGDTISVTIEGELP